MIKILKKIEEFEIKLDEKIERKYKYLILYCLIISCYFIGYVIGKIIF